MHNVLDVAVAMESGGMETSYKERNFSNHQTTFSGQQLKASALLSHLLPTQISHSHSLSLSVPPTVWHLLRPAVVRARTTNGRWLGKISTHQPRITFQ